MTPGRGRREGGGPRASDPPSDEAPGSFADWAESRDDVKPIARRKVVAPPARPVVGPRAHAAATRTTSGPRSTDRDAHFHRPVEGEPLLGHRPSLRRRELKELRAGRIRPDVSVDLHGRDRGSARLHLTARVAAARKRGARCVLVIHGRGRHSESGEAVLRRALAEWLDAAPLRDDVIAFAPAGPADGGAGATYLLLR